MKQIYTTITVLGFLLVMFKCSALKEIRQDMRNSKSTIHLNNHVKEAKYNTKPIICFTNSQTK
jgi:hypothetical protein